jgi:ATP-dependent RNA helicase DeaD
MHVPEAARRHGSAEPDQRQAYGRARGPAGRSTPSADVVRLFIGAGRQAGIRPGDLVGAITGEAKITSRDLGAIEIADKFSLVEVSAGLANQVIDALRGTTIRGKKVVVRLERY